MKKLRLNVSSQKSSREAKAIQDGIRKYNDPFRVQKSQGLTISFKDPRGKVVAGLVGDTNWGWLFVNLLWVSEEFRSSGLGSKLMAAAENEARRRGCSQVWLDTFGFQAPGFYRKLGFRAFGRLKDYPKGYSRFFMTKKLR